MKMPITIIRLTFLLILMSTLSPAQEGFTPEWSRGIVWYQIFPERFRNGDPSNDPTAADQHGAYPFDDTSAFQTHPWTSDWYQLQPYEQKNGRNIWFNLQRRRYGGDLQGIIDKLDYLQSLGVEALYLTPVFWSPSSHKYDGRCYHHIDPTFGPDPAGDKKLMEQENPGDPLTWVWTKADQLALKLIDEVHGRKMYIIFDGVFNHLGAESFAFRDLDRRQKDSPYRDWFTVESWRDPAKHTEFKYKAWYGVSTLPALRQDSAGIVEGPKQYIFNATRRWMNPMNRGTAHGIDGWRLDVAYEIGHPFWKDWRRLVRSVNPQAYLTAELVYPIAETRPYLMGDEFDASMNYNFAFTLHDFFVQDAKASSVTQFDQRLKELREAFGWEVALNMQNLMDSHDATRIATAAANPDGKRFGDWGAYFPWSQKSNNASYNVRKPSAEQIRKQKLIAAFQMLYPGSPMIYYGDEAGMWGGNDPDCRKPMVWADMKYDSEAYNPDQTQHEPDEVGFNHELFDWYRKFIALRKDYAALRLGAYTTLVVDDARKLYAFKRTYGGEEVVVVVNRGSEPVKFTHELLRAGNFSDVFTNKPVSELNVEPMGVAVAGKR
jgi:cyclomaltodextrinase / maltogenic alpha-amylase / neopullulanase